MLDVKCPVCGTSFVVGDNDKPTVDPRRVNGTAFLVPKCVGKEQSDSEFMKSLWDKAQDNAKKSYADEMDIIRGLEDEVADEEYNLQKAKARLEDAWNELDKYDREDRVFAEYEKLKKGETKMNSVKGEKKMSKKDERLEALKAMGFDVDAMMSAGVDLSKFIKADDKVVEEIYANGYVKQSKLYRRLIASRYVGLLGWYDGIMSYDKWTENFNKQYSYQYQFDYTKKELHVLARLEKVDAEAFKEREQFFNKRVVITLCLDYIKDLKDNLLSYKIHKCKGVPYIKYHGVDIFRVDIDKFILDPLARKLSDMQLANSYEELEKLFNEFTKLKGRKDGLRYAIFKKLDWNTTKSAQWVDAFKGAGAYFAAINFIRYSDLKIKVNGSFLDKYKSEEYLKEKTREYGSHGSNSEYWRLHALVKETLKDNNFNMRSVIEKK